MFGLIIHCYEIGNVNSLLKLSTSPIDAHLKSCCTTGIKYEGVFTIQVIWSKKLILM